MSALRFRAHQGVATAGKVIFFRSVHTFDFEAESSEHSGQRATDEDTTSVVIGMLQLEFAIDSGTVLFAWGLHPSTVWIPGEVRPTHAHPGSVTVEDDDGFQPGISVGLAEVGEWSTVFDEGTGWARVAADQDQTDEQQVLIASGTVLGLVGDQLNSVWLHPQFQP